MAVQRTPYTNNDFLAATHFSHFQSIHGESIHCYSIYG
ncbi:hypothetical protein VCBJG01_2351 [Vibrio cholerae BJG-01]|nr:hypothetical protein VCBJG01_2351 [Vibrio cholerae BJG-01]EKY33932.1 hypothetical protein OSU_0377 [Vibrio cholerae PS15]